MSGLVGVAIFKGKATKHITHNELYDGWLADMWGLHMADDPLVHCCIWRSNGTTPMAAAERLCAAGLVLIEDTPNGPMITRTWRGSHALAKFRADKP